MSLKDQLKEDMKAAMKAREEGKTALSVIRMVNSAIKNADYVEGLLPFVRDVAKELGISKDGYRLIFNTGGKAGQTVFHMHAHLLGGEEMGWPEA